MKTNEQIFAEIEKQGYITEQQINLLKRRSDRLFEDQMNYNFLERFSNEHDTIGITVSPEQGMKGLLWLLKFIKKGVYGYREIEILKNATANDFEFRGFWCDRNGNYKPIYELCGMEYIPLAEPYIVG